MTIDQTSEPAQLEPAAEYTPDWPAIVNHLSAELEEEREAHRAWRTHAEAALRRMADDAPDPTPPNRATRRAAARATRRTK